MLDNGNDQVVEAEIVYILRPIKKKNVRLGKLGCIPITYLLNINIT